MNGDFTFPAKIYCWCLIVVQILSKAWTHMQNNVNSYAEMMWHLQSWNTATTKKQSFPNISKHTKELDRRMGLFQNNGCIKAGKFLLSIFDKKSATSYLGLWTFFTTICSQILNFHFFYNMPDCSLGGGWIFTFDSEQRRQRRHKSF